MWEQYCALFSPIHPHTFISFSIGTRHLAHSHAALHVVATGVLTKKGATLLKPGGALQKEGMPHDNNGLAKLGRVTRRLQSKLKAWAGDGRRPGASSPLKPSSGAQPSLAP